MIGKFEDQFDNLMKLSNYDICVLAMLLKRDLII